MNEKIEVIINDNRNGRNYNVGIRRIIRAEWFDLIQKVGLRLVFKWCVHLSFSFSALVAHYNSEYPDPTQQNIVWVVCAKAQAFIWFKNDWGDSNIQSKESLV